MCSASRGVLLKSTLEFDDLLMSFYCLNANEGQISSGQLARLTLIIGLASADITQQLLHFGTMVKFVMVTL